MRHRLTLGRQILIPLPAPYMTLAPSVASRSFSQPTGVLVPLIVLAVPLYDVVSVCWHRARAGVSPFRGDRCRIAGKNLVHGHTLFCGFARSGATGSLSARATLADKPPVAPLSNTTHTNSCEGALV